MKFNNWRGSVAVAALAASACAINEVNVPRTTSMLVVHGVLNTTANDQVVLLERSLSGTVRIRDTSFNPAEPILSDGGIPVIGAAVSLLTPTGQTITAFEDRTVAPSGTGAGVYRFRLPGSQLRTGERYQLLVRTAEGEQLSASTLIPGARIASPLTVSSFNRSRDTLELKWAAIPKARSYAVRIESPFGPFFLFTDSLRLRLTGELRNLFADDLPRVFMPGFEQALLVAAVDSNFYDYYRTQNDPFTGSGIVSRVQGGIGFFGSLVTIMTRALDVTADRARPIEGRFVYLPNVAGAARTAATEVSLYVESASAKSGLPAALSGKYTVPSLRTDGVLGTQLGETITLAFLANQSAYDTVAVFAGQLRGDTLVGAYRDRTGTAMFVKAP